MVADLLPALKRFLRSLPLKGESEPDGHEADHCVDHASKDACRACRRRVRCGPKRVNTWRRGRVFDVDVRERDAAAAELAWIKVKAWQDWSELSAGCSLLRTIVADWSDEALWKAFKLHQRGIVQRMPP